jgi:hypothetical protein
MIEKHRLGRSGAIRAGDDRESCQGKKGGTLHYYLQLTSLHRRTMKLRRRFLGEPGLENSFRRSKAVN